MRQAVKFGLFYLPSFYPKVKREPQFCVIMGTPEPGTAPAPDAERGEWRRFS